MKVVCDAASLNWGWLANYPRLGVVRVFLRRLLEQVARRHLPGGSAGHQKVQVLPGHAHKGCLRVAEVLRKDQGGDVHVLTFVRCLIFFVCRGEAHQRRTEAAPLKRLPDKDRAESASVDPTKLCIGLSSTRIANGSAWDWARVGAFR